MKINFLILLQVFVCFQALFGQAPPNIIVIYTDDMGYADLSCQGTVKDIQTPHIDELAKNGVRFTNGYVTAPQCSPSRAGLLTGRYQQRFGFETISEGPLPLSEITLADRLSEAGYTTGQVGKWHLEPNPATIAWVEQNIPGAVPLHGRYNEIPDSMLTPYMPGARGFDQYFTGYLNKYKANFDLRGNVLNREGEDIVQPGYRLDIQTGAALQFIQTNYQNPFFLYLGYFGPHVPLQASKEYLDRFPGEMPERRRYALAMIAAIDEGVGRIVSMLRKYGVYNNTLIIFASDNGAPLGITKEDVRPVNAAGGIWDGSLNEPLLGEKGMLTEGGIRVPFIISWSKLPQGKIYDKPVSTLDIAATAIAVAGLKKDPDLDGVNLISFLTGRKKKSPHPCLFWHFWSQSAVRHGEWKLIRAGDKASFLFNLDKDPEEKNNLILRQPKLAARLNDKLQNWINETMPTETPNRHFNRQEAGWYHYYLNLPALMKEPLRGD